MSNQFFSNELINKVLCSTEEFLENHSGNNCLIRKMNKTYGKAFKCMTCGVYYIVEPPKEGNHE